MKDSVPNAAVSTLDSVGSRQPGEGVGISSSGLETASRKSRVAE
jgi:hypothetical protein